MAAEAKHTCYEGCSVSSFQFYLEKSGEHAAVLKGVQTILPGEFKRIGAGKSSLDVLGVGSGGGEVDVQMLSLLKSTFPAVPITSDVVEGSSALINNFKALVAKTADLQNVSFSWHIVHSEEYEKQVKAKGDVKKFDFIHMIQMIYYVDNLSETIKFFHSLLKNNGRLMIIVESGFRQPGSLYHSPGSAIAHRQSLSDAMLYLFRAQICALQMQYTSKG
ncbi:histamine N-methyltransferase A [Nematolebias whitei]|uniref:histamine N-methyltransferase A n=1 Tax=Nematolebias whitei TaxID=451745 RepID=UPI001899EAC2|nr:histamine N-methyltransferase A [Nematolebias whitei]